LKAAKFYEVTKQMVMTNSLGGATNIVVKKSNLDQNSAKTEQGL